MAGTGSSRAFASVRSLRSQVLPSTNRSRSWLPLAGISALLFLASLLVPSGASAQENPYIVAYDHYLEEPGSLDVEYFSTFGTQRAGNDFHAYWIEFEYGINAWWTTEVYLDAQDTFHDGTDFTGFRWENRFRLLKHEHFVNPVLYVEYENTTAADKILKEVEGHDVESDYADSNASLNASHNHELEFKLLLSGTHACWNFTLNPLFVKNFPGDPWEFGYAIGASRPLALKASPRHCNFCRENFIVGAEMYGALGDTADLSLHDTSHYLAPVVAWNLPSDWTLRISPGFGLNDNSHAFVLRWGLSHEFPGFGNSLRSLFGGRR